MLRSLSCDTSKNGSQRALPIIGFVAWGLFWGWSLIAVGAETPAENHRCAVVEFYLSGSLAAERAVADEIKAFAARRGGIELVVRDIEADPSALERFGRIRTGYREPNWQTPLAYACGQAVKAETAEELIAGLQNALVVEVFTRRGCSRCERVKTWLPSVMPRYPAWRLSFRELSTDTAATRRLQQLVSMHQASAASVPVIHVCGRLVIGFDQAETTGKRIEDLLTTWSRPCPGEADSTQWKRRPVFQLVRLQNSSQGLARPPPPADEPFQLPLPPLPVGAVPDRPTAEEASVAKSETTGATGIELPWLG